MSSVDWMGWAAGTVDGNASVAEAADALNKDKGNPVLQAAYSAAYANAVAAEYALVPGVGAVFASRAVSMDINLIYEKSQAGEAIEPADVVALAGNLATVAAQGVALLGLAEVEIPIGALVFTADQIGTAVGAILTAASASLDMSTIISYVSEGMANVGVVPNESGVYAVENSINSSLSINLSTFQSSLEMGALDLQIGGNVYVPNVGASGNITGFTVQAPTDAYQYSNGTSGANFDNASVVTNVTGVPDSPRGASPMGVWTFTDIGGTENNAILVQYSDGSFGNLSGEPGNYTVTMEDVNAPLLDQSNSVSLTDDNGQISAVVSGSGASLDMSNGAVYLDSGTSLTLSGSDNTIVGSASDLLTLDGSNNNVTVGTDSTIFVTGQSDAITTSGSEIEMGGNTSIVVDGSEDIVVGAAGDSIAVSGLGDSLNVSGALINEQSGSNITVSGADDTLVGNSIQVSFADGSTGQLVSGSQDTINAGESVVMQINGNSENIVEQSGADVTAAGSDDSVNGSGATITFVSGSGGELVVGSNDVINAGNSVTAQIDGNNENITAQSGADITAAGFNDAITGNYATINFVSGSGEELVVGSNDVINAGNSVTADIDGNSESIVEQSGADVTAAGFNDEVTGSFATINFVSGSGDELVSGSNDVVNAGNGVTAQIDGNSEDIIEQSAADITAAGLNDEVTGDYATINFVSGSTGELVVGSYDLVNAGNSVTAQVDGNSEYISELSGADVTAAGAFDTVVANSATIDFLSGSTNELIEGSNDIVDLGNSVTGEVIGSTDRIDGGTSDVIEIDGHYDSFYGSHDIIDYLGDATGDVMTGADDSLDFGSTGEDYGDDDYWDDDYGFYGLAGSDSVVQSAISANIGSVAEYELSQGDYAGAVAAQLGLVQARQAAAGMAGGVGAAVSEGGVWSSNVITWSAEGDLQAYDAQIAQAFSTWAAASGLTFEEVNAEDAADIRLSFADLDTADSAIAGYTTVQAKSGEIESASIALEDPLQDPLVTGGDGQLTYTGTDATLSQMLLHEIGHALGLADDSDSNSIMYYELNAANRTFDATDTAGVQALYGEAPTADDGAIVTVQLSNMLAALASFDPASSTAANIASGGTISQEETLLAATVS